MENMDDNDINIKNKNHKEKKAISKLFDYLDEKNEDACLSFIKNGNIKVWTIVDDHGFTPLHKSVHLNFYLLTGIILEKSINNLSDKEFKSFINAKTNKGYTALHYASFQGDISIIKLLIKNGADIFMKTNAGFSVIHFASQSNKLTSFFYFVKKYKLDINIKDKKGNTCLHFACFYGSNKIVNYLLCQKNIKINEKNYEGYTPLHFCVLSKNEKALKKLLLCYADINIENNKGEKAIDIASKNMQTSMIKLLSSFTVIINQNIHHPITVYIFHIINIILAFVSFYLLKKYKIYYGIWCSSIILLIFVFYYIDPSVKKEEINLINEIDRKEIIIDEYCTICNIKRNKKDVHCFICCKCIFEFDHHCFWLGKCIGEYNKNLFGLVLIIILINYYINLIIASTKVSNGYDQFIFIYFILGINIFICCISSVLIFPLLKLYFRTTEKNKDNYNTNNIDYFKNENNNLLPISNSFNMMNKS